MKSKEKGCEKNEKERITFVELAGVVHAVLWVVLVAQAHELGAEEILKVLSVSTDYSHMQFLAMLKN